jgi:hypothetical protein
VNTFFSVIGAAACFLGALGFLSAVSIWALDKFLRARKLFGAFYTFMWGRLRVEFPEASGTANAKPTAQEPPAGGNE